MSSLISLMKYTSSKNVAIFIFVTLSALIFSALNSPRVLNRISANHQEYLPLILSNGGYHNPSIAGCKVFPSDNIWNRRVDNLPLDPNSDDYIESIGRNETLHPDFGSGYWPPDSNSPIGIPYNIVDSTQNKVFVNFEYADESDPGPYPIPDKPLIEGGENSIGDRHLIILDKDNCILYELYNAHEINNTWYAGSGAIFDLGSNLLRPAGWTSADAAGLPILPGLIRFEEVATNEINHAIRFTAPKTRADYVWPARHYASSYQDTQYPPMGQRFRLRGDYDITSFDPQIQTILRAMQRYGIILADNGSPWYLSGIPDERWDNEILHQLSLIKGADLEAVDVRSLMIDEDSGQTQP